MLRKKELELSTEDFNFAPSSFKQFGVDKYVTKSTELNLDDFVYADTVYLAGSE